MSRQTMYSHKPTKNSRFAPLFEAQAKQAAIGDRLTAERDKKRRLNSKPKAARKAAQAKTSAPVVTSAKAIKQPLSVGPSAEELKRREATDAKIDADIAAAMKRKEARNIKRMWTRAIIKSNRTSIAHGSSLADYERSIQHATAKPTGQASTDAFWRGIQDKIEARGW